MSRKTFNIRIPSYSGKCFKLAYISEIFPSYRDTKLGLPNHNFGCIHQISNVCISLWRKHPREIFVHVMIDRDVSLDEICKKSASYRNSFHPVDGVDLAVPGVIAIMFEMMSNRSDLH